jgi:hypothetical protein
MLQTGTLICESEDVHDQRRYTCVLSLYRNSLLTTQPLEGE